MPTISVAAATIQADPAPVVFLDSCVLLDVIRAPNRGAALTVEAAIELLGGVSKMPPTVHLVIACPTPTEWSDHVAETVDECDAAILKVDAIGQTWGLLGGAGLPAIPPQVWALSGQLRDISKALLDASILLEKDADALGRAIDRVIAGQRPAKHGGKGTKDCVILEHAVGLAVELRHNGFGEPCVFASSNVNDFGTTNLHPSLQAVFGPPANLTYAVGLLPAVQILKAAGWAP